MYVCVSVFEFFWDEDSHQRAFASLPLSCLGDLPVKPDVTVLTSRLRFSLNKAVFSFLKVNIVHGELPCSGWAALREGCYRLIRYLIVCSCLTKMSGRGHVSGDLGRVFSICSALGNFIHLLTLYGLVYFYYWCPLLDKGKYSAPVQRHFLNIPHVWQMDLFKMT